MVVTLLAEIGGQEIGGQIPQFAFPFAFSFGFLPGRWGLRVRPRMVSRRSRKLIGPHGRPVAVRWRMACTCSGGGSWASHADQSETTPGRPVRHHLRRLPVGHHPRRRPVGRQNRVLAPAAVGRGTGPGVLLRPLGHARPHGVPLHVGDGRPQVALVQRRRAG